MANLKIRVFKRGETDPETTITIPANILKIASRLIPHRLADILRDKGIDIDEIIRLSDNPDAKGTMVEIEEHKKNEKVVIALE
jgi:hypothetical protein